VPKNGPCDSRVFELVNADLAGEGTVGLVEDVLGCYFDAFAEVFAGEEEVERGWGDDDLCVTSLDLLALSTLCSILERIEGVHTSVLVELCVIEVVYDITDRLDRSVHLEVACPPHQSYIPSASSHESAVNSAMAGSTRTSDKELATHVCDLCVVQRLNV
jgi:hypothetical protein